LKGNELERFRWDLGRELPGDRDLRVTGDGLANRRVALLICGGIAAYRSPDLIRALRRQGAEVVVYATPEALRFVSREVLEWCSLSPVIDRLDGRAQHVEDARSIDHFLLAPATYSTINKFALGLADNAVTTTLAGALGRLEVGRASLSVAPTMHGDMVNDVLRASLASLADRGVEILTPRRGAGKANIPEVDTLVAHVIRSVRRRQPGALNGRSILVTGGATPVAIDSVRQLTNRFSGATAVRIAQSLWQRGANVSLLLGGAAVAAPAWLSTQRVADFDAYSAACMSSEVDTGVFSAAVADYRPRTPSPGKLASGVKDFVVELEPTHKVIDAWHARFPDRRLVSFKLEVGLATPELLEIAQRRLTRGSDVVVANQLGGEGPRAFVVTRDQTHTVETTDLLAEVLADVLAG
jgi:phosphopantothenoylcysteine decarboxylase / phosphopantothenate---cysteine ligase